MEKSLVSPTSFKIGDKLFFLIIFIYQLLFIFQGFSFNDEGFHFTFYQNIFREPQSVQYNFMFWFSGVIGGIFMYLFPNGGIFGFRLFGIVTETATIIVVYRMLKNYVKAGPLQVGLFMAVIMLSDDPKDFNYDNLSALLYVSAACVLFNGLRKNKNAPLLISGGLLALNFFTRLTNVLGIFMGVVIIYHAFLEKKAVKDTLKKLIFFAGGFIAVVVLVFGFMKLLGQLTIFLDNIKTLAQVGKSKENTHGLSHLIPSYVFGQLRSLKLATVLLVILTVAAAIYGRLKNVSRRKIFVWASGILTVALLARMSLKDDFSTYMKLMSCVAGLIFFAALVILFFQYDHNKKILMMLGCFILLALPAGSDYLYASERFAFWLCLPLAFDFYFAIRPVTMVTGNRFSNNNTLTALLSFYNERRKYLQTIGKWLALSGVLFFMYYSVIHTWSDSADRTKMVYPVNNKFCNGIFTTKPKADAINELLAESAKYIKKGDYVLAYDAIPMFYYLSETKPFLRNSWPWLYDREVFEAELDKAVEQKKIRPVVIFQKANTIDNRNWPGTAEENADWDFNNPRNKAINKFLAANNYKKVWETEGFCIYVP
jgi:hypothetical protein